MSNPTKILVWLIASRLTKWRGEGITQTVENTLIHAPDSVRFTLLVGPGQYSEAVEAFVNYPNIEVTLAQVLPLPVIKPKPFNEKDVLRGNNLLLAVAELLIRKLFLNFLIKAYHRFAYTFEMLVLSLMQRLGWVYSGYDLIWLPVANLPFVTMLKGAKVVSFWDPFVFEYREFKDISQVLWLSFKRTFSATQFIVTQSSNNKRYLQDIYRIPENKISVLPLGHPDYSQQIDNAAFIRANRHKHDLDVNSIWAPRRIYGQKLAEMRSVYLHEKVNQSILFRLLSGVKPETKFFLISTQSRPYKGFDQLFAIFDQLIKTAGSRYDFRFILTSEPPPKLKERYPWTVQKIHEITRVTNSQLACLCALSDLVIHPSFVEGGLGTYPQFEAASLGVPSLNNYGRHMQELEHRSGPDIALTYCDFTDVNSTVARMLELLENPDLIERNISASFKARIPWNEAAAAFAEVFVRTAKAS
jgi:glycosyltransferase involved in cell wall biosynthesis